MAERVLLTPAGEIRLRAELKRLKSNDRPNVIAAIRTIFLKVAIFTPLPHRGDPCRLMPTDRSTLRHSYPAPDTLRSAPAMTRFSHLKTGL